MMNQSQSLPGTDAEVPLLSGRNESEEELFEDPVAHRRGRRAGGGLPRTHIRRPVRAPPVFCGCGQQFFDHYGQQLSPELREQLQLRQRARAAKSRAHQLVKATKADQRYSRLQVHHQMDDRVRSGDYHGAIGLGPAELEVEKAQWASGGASHAKSTLLRLEQRARHQLRPF